MGTRTLMTASAMLMAAVGLALTFAPREILHHLDSDATGWEQTLAQLCGALYCGFAFMNWMAKGVMLGGVYGRPIVIGNLVHCTMAALALFKTMQPRALDPACITLMVFYAFFAVLFGVVMVTHPGKSDDAG